MSELDLITVNHKIIKLTNTYTLKKTKLIYLCQEEKLKIELAIPRVDY